MKTALKLFALLLVLGIAFPAAGQKLKLRKVKTKDGKSFEVEVVSGRFGGEKAVYRITFTGQVERKWEGISLEEKVEVAGPYAGPGKLTRIEKDYVTVATPEGSRRFLRRALDKASRDYVDKLEAETIASWKARVENQKKKEAKRAYEGA